MKNKKLLLILGALLVLALLLGGCGKKEAAGSCTLAVSCQTVLENADVMKALSAEKKAILPADGVIVAETQVEFGKDETAMDVLQRYFRDNKLHIDVQTSAYGAYVNALGNLYGGDGGDWSGWLFFVNDEVASVGADQVVLKDGDKIEFKYSCDGGPDLGIKWE